MFASVTVVLKVEIPFSIFCHLEINWYLLLCMILSTSIKATDYTEENQP